MRLILEKHQVYLQSFINNATYHPHEPWFWCYISDSQTIWFWQRIFLIHFWCSTLHLMKLVQQFLYNSGKGRCTRYMWSNNMFVLWNRISAIFYEDRKYCLHISLWFLTSWTFRITSLLNLNEYQCYHHLDLSMIEGFDGFVMFSFSPSNAKETLQKMLARKCSCHGTIGNKC